MTGYNQLNAYKKTSITTAGQGSLILMLYNGAINHLDKALELFPSGYHRYDEINRRITKTQDIITELMASLDFDRGGEISKQLFSLYFYFNDQLMKANMNKDSEMIKTIKEMLVELKGAWEQVSKTPAEPAGMGLNISR